MRARSMSFTRWGFIENWGVNGIYPQRVYVELRVSFSADGTMAPVRIKWEDGRVFKIDRVLDVRRAASDAGSMGLRYTVRIMGQVRRLFFEDAYSDTGRARWFVEQGAGS